MQNTSVKDIMCPNPVFVKPEDTLQMAAQEMKSSGCGILPVGEKGNLRGMITDRDIVIRAVSEGMDPGQETVSSCMTESVIACLDTDSLLQAAEVMRENNVSRLVVKDKAGTVCGLLSFGSIMRKDRDREEISAVVASATGKRAA